MADFRCPAESSRKAPLFARPSEGRWSPQVAVVAPGSLLRGTAEPSHDELWLCVVLAKSNPLRAKQGLDTCYARVGCRKGDKPRRGAPRWVGPTHVKSVNSMLDLQWERPFYVGEPVTYTVDMQPEGGKWGTVWTSQLGEEFGSARIEVTLNWPCCTSQALLRVTAASGPWLLTCPPLAVSGLASRSAVGDARLPGTSAVVITTGIGEKCPHPVERVLDLSNVPRDRASMLRRAAQYAPKPLRSPTQKRIVLRRLPDVAPHGRPLRKVLIMGIYHSCTSAMATELRRRFDVRVVNEDPRRSCNTLDGFWKHRVHRQRPALIDDETLTILMVKEPYFWLKSMARCFYQVHPVSQGQDGSIKDVPSREFKDLFGLVEHDQVIYPNAAALWSDAITSYLDDDVYPARSSVVVRAEDFLFNFHAVMDELGAMGLQERTAQDERLEPLTDRTKVVARSRDEALVFYSNPRNRRHGFTLEQLLDVDGEVDAEITDLLGYGPDAVQTWLPAK